MFVRVCVCVCVCSHVVGLVHVSSGLMQGSGRVSLTVAQLHQRVDVLQTPSPLLTLSLLHLLPLLMGHQHMFISELT